jgi:RimJ/RimL family protein N-acetyltransferase
MGSLEAEPREYALRDGTRVLIRAILPDDKDRLQAGLRRMSEKSRYYRFMSYVNRLSDAQLRYLTEIDYVSHLAWIALDPADPVLPVLGVARCIRIEKEPDAAEAAVAVVDSHQRRGLGTVLLGLLGAAAARIGIRRFRAYVLADNIAMLHLFRDLGATIEPEDATVRVVDMAVPEDPRDLPDTAAGRVFRAVARREISLPHPKFHEPGES